MDFLTALSNRFPDGEILFDAFSRYGNSVAEKMVRKNGMENASIKLSVKNGKEFERWSPRIELKDSFAYFERVNLNKPDVKFILYKIINVLFKICNFYHLRFKTA